MAQLTSTTVFGNFSVSGDFSLSGTLTNNGTFLSLATTVSEGSTKIKMGRSLDQHYSIFGDASGNHLVSVSSAGNPKSNLQFGYSIDGGSSLGATFTLNGSSGTIWHSGNDGPGSTLNADLLDGLHGGSFLRTDTDNTAAFGLISTSHHIEAGRGSGSVSLTHNDGHGNCNVNFNHRAGVPDTSGSSARITSGVDSTNGSLAFQVASNTTNGTAVTLSTVFSMTLGACTSNVELRSTADVVAYYSDERLKDKTGNIENALDKINSLEAFTYTPNELAKQYGYTDTKQRVGVSAQQVLKILPEAVTRAPFDIEQDEDGNERSKSGEEYLTVDYGKLTPLLIEAIKEQDRTINKQEERITKLETIIEKLVENR